MAKAKKKSRAVSVLPAHKPKRTGRSGVGPKEDDPTAALATSFEEKIDAAVDGAAQPGENLEIAGHEPKKKGRQPRLPQMDDPKIEELEGLAEDYAEVRDERMELSTRESNLKKDLLSAMHRLKREKYNHGGVVITVVHEKENVKVRINKPEEDQTEG